jgi:hypothetical protein
VLYGGIGFSWRYDGNYKEVESIQAAVIMPNKKEVKAKKKNRNVLIESTQKKLQ